MAKEVGKVSVRVIALLSLQLQENQPICMGSSNVSHMKKSHPADYAKYGQYIQDILSKPDYVLNNNRVKNFIQKGTLKKV